MNMIIQNDTTEYYSSNINLNIPHKKTREQIQEKEELKSLTKFVF